MHNLEGFGFRSDCFLLKDNLNYMSSAFPGPKPCSNHQICCHGPLTPVPGPQGHIPSVPRLLESTFPGEWEPTAAAAPLQQCSTWRTGILRITDRKEGPAWSFPATALLPWIIVSFLLPLLCWSVRIPTIMWSVTWKGIKAEEIISRHFTKASLSHGGPEKFCADGSCYKWREWNLEILAFHLYDT